MIDVSRFRIGDRCPRCVERRVWVVSEERNEWLCAPNAIPFPVHGQMTYHDAAEWDHVPLAARLQYAEEMSMLNEKSWIRSLINVG